MNLRDTLLLIGGPDSDRPMLRDIFRDEYNLLEADGVEQGLFLLQQNLDCIVAVIVDRPPPKGKGDSFLEAAHQQNLIGDIPMLAIITPSGSGRLEELAFSLGASDVLLRPFTPAVVKRRIRIMVDLYRNHQYLLSTLEKQAKTIRHTNEVMVDALSSIIEYRSAESGSHTLRIRRFTEILLNEVARSCPEYALDERAISLISSAAALHDIGKISIPDQILNKPGKLTDEEREAMKAHTVNGAEMIETLGEIAGEDYLRYAYNICRSHHERWDGSGYPDGLSGEDIPLCAQVVGVADVFDALTNDRVYKSAVPPHTAVNMILNGECGSFSPKLTACFKRVFQQFIQLALEYANGRSPKADKITLPLPAPAAPNDEINTLQMTQLKYQALLHYIKATVIEMDLDFGTYHVVYNPIPNFRPIPKDFPLAKTLDAAALTYVHPDDMELSLKEYAFLLEEFFPSGLRKHSFTHRLYTSALGGYRSHRVTFLRVETDDPAQRKAILIWQPMPAAPVAVEQSEMSSVGDWNALLYLMSSVVCRRNDRWYTLVRGSGDLLDLLGYSGDEIRDTFGSRFLDLVLPEDREMLRRHVDQSLQTGTKVTSEYRMRHKDGRILWILEKGCVVTGADGEEYFYGALTDNSHSHAMQAELEEALQRNQLLIEQSDDVIMDWDILGDRVQLSPNFKKLFGYDPVPDNLRSHKLGTTRIHPDDLTVLKELAGKLRQGQTDQECEVRIANIDNKYLWCRLRCTLMRDEQGRPCRVIGTLSNIDNAKRNYLALQEQAQQDPLTGLLNKAATQSAIRTYLDAREHSGCALLMIDLDDFKGINDQFGHLFGDTVLTRVARTIRRLFRNGDLIGRVGGDEFMVLMKDVHDVKLLEDRCKLLLDEFGELFREGEQTCHVGCSVGVALAPEHGTTFHELFYHADQALYHAKQSGKNSFTLYEQDLNITIQQFSTPIDSNEQPGLANSSLVRAVFHQLSHSNDLEKTIQDVLALVGQRTNVSRVYIFENNDENTHCSNTFEWCNDGISPEKDNLQNICYETDLPDWESNYDERGILFCTDISQLPPVPRALVEAQGIKSLLHCAIREHGVFRGYIGLDECEAPRIWTQEQVDILVFLSEVVASFLLKKRLQDKADALTANLYNILGTQHNWMYVIDPATYQLSYINAKTMQAIPKLCLGDVCYRAIMGQDTPCADCPLAKLDRQGFARSRIHSQKLGVPVVSEANRIQWDGREAVLITCRRPD